VDAAGEPAGAVEDEVAGTGSREGTAGAGDGRVVGPPAARERGGIDGGVLRVERHVEDGRAGPVDLLNDP
jgi:hypothetical protein